MTSIRFMGVPIVNDMMRSLLYISGSIILLLISTTINRVIQKLKRVENYHNRHRVMPSVRSYPMLFDQHKKIVGNYPKHYPSLKLILDDYRENDVISNQQELLLTQLCDSLDVNCEYLTVPMKLDKCLAAIDMPKYQSYRDYSKDIIIGDVSESEDSLTLTIALFQNLNSDSVVRVTYFMDGEQIESSELSDFTGDIEKLSAHIYNPVTSKTNIYPSK